MSIPKEFVARRVLIYGGCDLHLVGRDQEKPSAIAAELKASFTVGDVLNSGLFARVAEEVGDTLDGLVYAVGTINLRTLQRLTEADFLNDFRINAVGAALAAGILTNDRTAASIAELHALQRLGNPGDIAGLTAFLRRTLNSARKRLSEVVPLSDAA